MWMPAHRAGRAAQQRRHRRCAKAITGRRRRSFTRLATRPTTPWCQLSSNRHTPLRCTARGRARQTPHGAEGLVLHARLDRAPLSVELIEPRGERCADGCVVGEQALDADASCRRCGRRRSGAARRAKARSVAVRSARRAPGERQQRADAGHAAAGADALQALRHEHAVVGIQRHDVGDRAERDEVEELRDAGRRRGVTRLPSSGGRSAAIT